MKSFSSSLVLAVVVAASVASSFVDAFSLAPRGGIARNPYVSVARQVSLSDPGIEATAESSSFSDSDSAPVRHTVYVGNLPFTTTTDTVRQMFEGVVSVKAISLPTNPNFLDEVTGMPMSKGFAFVDVEREEDIAKAIAELHDIEIEGRPLRVNKMMPKEEINRTGNSQNKNFTPDGTFHR
jgi:RNA recognition motif-containing protein